MSEQVRIDVIADDAQLQATLKADEEAIDRLTREWKAKQAEILSGIRHAGQVINQTIQAFRIALSAMNMTLGPIENALLSLITTGVSVAVSVATMLISGIITAPAGLILAAAAFGVQIGATAALINNMTQIRRTMSFIEKKVEYRPTDIVSGLGGF